MRFFKVSLISFLLLLTFNDLIVAQKYQPSYQSNANLNIQSFLAGVKYCTVILSESAQQRINNGEFSQLYNIIHKYLEAIGFEYIAITSKEKESLQACSSYCDIAFFSFYFDYKDEWLNNIGFEIYSCLGDNFKFKSNKEVMADDRLENLYEQWTKLYWIKKPIYSRNYRLNLPSQPTSWTIESIKKFLDKKKPDWLEGIWETIISSSHSKESKYTLGIIKNNANNYDIIYFAGSKNYDDWVTGERKGLIKKATNTSLYNVTWISASKVIEENGYCNLDERGYLNIHFTDSNNQNSEIIFEKIFPLNRNSSDNEQKSSATAIAISPSGYVLTSHHVIEDMHKFNLVVPKEGSSVKFNLQLVGDDPKNDLVVLKIMDNEFKGFGPIPYNIYNKQCDVGEDIFVLGFPLTNTMGNEIKLTNGLISSRSGFQGDMTSYQISAPVQPGNSGGPVFDKNGNLIGVISARHLGAENVSYAVKSTLLNNLLESINLKNKPNSTNQLKGKSLSEQVKILRKYVFMIEVE